MYFMRTSPDGRTDARKIDRFRRACRSPVRIRRSCVSFHGLKPSSATLVLLLMAASACRTAGQHAQAPIVQPGAPGESSRVINRDAAVDLSHVRYTPADVQFMQGMISHHAQAVEMTRLLASRTASDEM